MSLETLLDLWSERDRRYRLPQGTGLTAELAEGVRANRGWEIATYLTKAADRRRAFSVLSNWVPPHPVRF